MAENLELRTPTMASVYRDQGHYHKALEIYRYLVQQHPEREDYAAALSDTEQKLERQKRMRNLADLFQEWIALHLDVKRLEYLQRIRARLDEGRPKPDEGGLF
jgi:hypothetical protein